MKNKLKVKDGIDIECLKHLGFKPIYSQCDGTLMYMEKRFERGWFIHTYAVLKIYTHKACNGSVDLDYKQDEFTNITDVAECLVKLCELGILETEEMR